MVAIAYLRLIILINIAYLLIYVKQGLIVGMTKQTSEWYGGRYRDMLMLLANTTIYLTLCPYVLLYFTGLQC